MLEIIAAFTGSDFPTEIVGLSLFSGCVQLRYDVAHHELFFTGNATAGAYRSTVLILAPGEDLNLHVYVDGSIVEAIANHRAPISVIVTPPAGEEFEAVSAIGQVGASGGLQVWPLRPSGRRTLCPLTSWSYQAGPLLRTTATARLFLCPRPAARIPFAGALPEVWNRRKPPGRHAPARAARGTSAYLHAAARRRDHQRVGVSALANVPGGHGKGEGGAAIRSRLRQPPPPCRRAPHTLELCDACCLPVAVERGTTKDELAERLSREQNRLHPSPAPAHAE